MGLVYCLKDEEVFMLEYVNLDFIKMNLLVHFAGMDNLIKVVLLFVLVFCCVAVRWYKSKKAIRILSSSRLQLVVLRNASLFRRAIKYSLSLMGFVALFLALLQPQWNKKEEQVQQQGRDLLIAVDISRSMLCTDEKPTRLEFAKEKIKKILYNLKCERVGLIVFAGEAVVQCPLTIDYGAFFMFLDNLDVATISSGTTTIDGAIHTALGIFEAMPEKKTKLLCLFTDGEDFSTNLAGVKDKAVSQNLSIFTFGIGSGNGAPVPIYNNQGKHIGFEKDDKGTVVMSRLNEGILKNLSEQTGGKYIRVTRDERDVQRFIKLVELFEKDKMGNHSFERYQQQYPYFIAVSFLCFGLEWLL